ncbi:MAG: Xaa-Pro peptidase family protein [Candidatus Omnitrophica bacterium]|jgi:Xaa-Pro aminopeptidase|nr:Xaa-Pro peptidase family protein [Candidatus Omnitrophota bacterium]MDD5078959.1 Xaa-Pro peptidase family protein [Candidatus Omnitrophota bacterium]
MNPKITNIYRSLAKDNIDGLLLSSDANCSYLCGYPSRDSYLLVSSRKNVYFTDSRYTAEARKHLTGCAVEPVSGSVFRKIAEACRGLKVKCLGFEERHLPYAEYRQIRKELPDPIGLAPTWGLVEELRQIKTAEEIARIRKACAITMEAFEFIREYIRPGVKEIEVAAELERFIRYRGAGSAAFDIIVASGPNSSFPHHITSQRRIKDNEPVFLDMGVDYQGYKSDLTRVILLGKMNTLVGNIYRIVLEAQKRAISGIRPGAPISRIDSLARDHIEKKGYGGYFGHGLGHGLGLEIHEAPHIGGKQIKKLQAGMVFTVEPAIYIPGKFGIRIEDMVLVTRKGSEVISGSLNK